MSKRTGLGRGRTRGRVRKKKHTRRGKSAAARKADREKAARAAQRPVTEVELDRLGKYGIEEARQENEERYQKRLVGSSDGQMYYKTPHGQMIKTDGKAAIQPDGTLRTLPPAPRPTKRERAKMKRRLKREERK